MKQKYKNGCGPNWMDRYIDPATGKKKVWNYKPAKTVMGCYRNNKQTLEGIKKIEADLKAAERARVAAAFKEAA